MANVIPSTYTLEDARRRVLDVIGEQSGVNFTYNKIDALLNQCARDIYTRTNEVYLEAFRNTTAGSAVYPLSTPQSNRGYARVEYVSYNGSELDASAPVIEQTSSGTPTKYWVDGNSVHLDPIPDASGKLKVRYRRDYTPVVSPTDEFCVSDSALDAAVLFAGYMLKIADDEYTAAGMLRNAYENAYAVATALDTGVYSASNEYTYD